MYISNLFSRKVCFKNRREGMGSSDKKEMKVNGRNELRVN